MGLGVGAALRYTKPRDSRGNGMTALRSLLVAALLAGILAACGVRGPLEPPPGAKDEPKDPPFILDPLVE
jgi:predicted small lipoprotein YifL